MKCINFMKNIEFEELFLGDDSFYHKSKSIIFAVVDSVKLK